MAEIKIEKKKPIWPWVIALLLIGAVVYYIFLRDDQAQSESAIEIENTSGTGSTAQ